MPTPIPGQPGPTAKPAARDRRPTPAEAERLRRAREHDIDEELEQSFPASDPPSWTMGVTSPDPSVSDTSNARDGAGNTSPSTRR
jgi:hypothetical protein